MSFSFHIRSYRPSDFELLRGWWEKRREVPPTEEMMPHDSSFVIEHEGKPIASMCWLSTNCSAIAYCAHFVSDPEADRTVRGLAVNHLFKFICDFAKAAGFKRLLAFGYQPKLTDRFKELGFRHTIQNLNSFCKDL